MKLQIDPQSTIHYEEAGQGSIVVFLHAFPLSSAMWETQIAELAKTHRVIAPDLRGFGGTSTFAGQPSIPRMADDVALLLHGLHIVERVSIVGLSMGGYVALSFARKFPQRLSKLVLADSKAEGDTEEGKAKRLDMIELAEQGEAAAVIDAMLPNLLGAATRNGNAALVERIRALGSDQSATGVQDALRALRDRPDATAWLGQIAAPTLVIVGEDDTLTPPAMARTLATGVPNAQLITIPGAGHLSNLEQPETFNMALMGFLGAE